MSRNNKNAQRLVAARAISATRKAGGRGSKATTPQHGKDPEKRLYTSTRRPTGDSKGKQDKAGGNRVVAVCGNEALIYGAMDERTGIRPLVDAKEFPTNGAAKTFAAEYENPSSTAPKKPGVAR